MKKEVETGILLPQTKDPTSHQEQERSKKAFSPKALGGSIAPLKASFLTSGLQENEFLLL